MAHKRCAVARLIYISVLLIVNSFWFLDAFSVEIEVGGGCGSTYFIGDKVVYSIDLSEGAYVTIRLVTPDDERYIIKDTYERSGPHSFSGTVTGPVGTHTLHVEARNRYGDIVTGSCSYVVVDFLDSDQDGISDKKDKCNNPGCAIVDSSGCPKDSDNDGINDCEDSCSNPGCVIVDSSGCPKDSDNDGINDCEDSCPQEEGDASNKGCPVPESSTPLPSPSAATLPSAHATSYMLFFALLLVAGSIGFLVYRTVRKAKPKSISEIQQDMRNLDEMLENNLISQKEYDVTKKELEEQLRKLERNQL
jgi:hypothetical protein